MKRLIFVIATMLLTLAFTSCGVGNYSVSSGLDDSASICFTAKSEYPITVSIDNETFETFTVKDIAHKTRRNIKKTAKHSLKTTSGQHSLKVVKDGETVYTKQVLISTGETKIIEL